MVNPLRNNKLVTKNEGKDDWGESKIAILHFRLRKVDCFLSFHFHLVPVLLWISIARKIYGNLSIAKEATQELSAAW